MSERLIRVERFEELRAGMIVVVKDCRGDCCMRPMCRGMLTTREVGQYNRKGQPYWLRVPEYHYSGIYVATVARGEVYRVDDGLDLAAETAQAKRKPVQAR